MTSKDTAIVQRLGEVKLLPFSTNVPWHQGVVARQLKGGRWRAYITEDTNSGPQYPYTLKAWACRDTDWQFLQAPTLRELVDLLKTMPFLKYHEREAELYGY